VTREAIIEAALGTLQEEGAAGLSLREVARRLGVTLPSIQRHFQSKDSLWRACVDRATSEVLVERANFDDAGPTEGAWLAAHVRALTARSGRLPGLTAAILNDTSRGAEDRLDYLVTRAEPVLDRARERIERGQLAGRVRPVDVEVILALLAVGLTSMASSRSGLRRLFGIDLADAADAEHFAEALVDLLRHGLEATPGAPLPPSARVVPPNARAHRRAGGRGGPAAGRR